MKIDRYQQISTKKGDTGMSRNYSNEAYTKDDVLFDTLGTMDELSSWLGLTYHHGQNEWIKDLQRTLQNINALIATNPVKDKDRYERLTPLKESDVQALERLEAEMLNQKPLKPQFVLPGSETSKLGAYYDVARALTRRAERILVRFINQNAREDLGICRQYINRLSDLLYIMARYEATD